MKNNVRFFRYTDQVARIIESSEGANMNEKFENLVLLCMRAAPECMDRIKELEEEIDSLNKEKWSVIADLASLEQIKRAQLRVVAAYDGLIESAASLQTSLDGLNTV